MISMRRSELSRKVCGMRVRGGNAAVENSSSGTIWKTNAMEIVNV